MQTLIKAIETIINYIRQIFYISIAQTSLLVILIIFLLFFVVILSLNRPGINFVSKNIFFTLFIILACFTILNANTDLISKGRLSLLPVKCKQTSFVDDFVVSIKKCNLYNRNSYSFELLVTNKNKKRNLYVYANQTRLLDWFGNDNFAQKVSIGNRQFERNASTIMPRNIPIKVSIVFEDTYIEGRVISLLDIKTDRANFSFHNIPIYR